MKKGMFITFEGVEGSGKTTQIRKAAAFLRRKGIPVLVLREPGGTTISEAIRKILLDRKNNRMFAETELLLYLAARAQILREKILPALEKGATVICDRFEDSTLAYQGFARKMSLADIQTVSRLFVRGDFQPDLTFLLDVNPGLGLYRAGRRNAKDRMESQALKFHEQVRKGFLTLAKSNPKRYVVINGEMNIPTIAGKIEEVLAKCIRKK